ncbi:hypothetical protein T02_9964 [Trichinella nativa]|uniref:Uncharacterized protein n=1 Tax=Trichinella nativa TaxID=6335 RepID=A0A0V1KU28_9BILA|nr:hypothetical protein T02_9964 [Trichinella nativa]
MLPTKRELGKRGGTAGSNRTDDTGAEMNLQFDTGVSSFNNERGSNPVEARNEPARESGSSHSVKLTVFGVPYGTSPTPPAPSRLRPKQENGPSRCDGCHSGNFRQTAAPARIGKLTELTLPLFDGEVLEFPTFWAQFQASVHVNTELDDATKFAYLLSNTTGRVLEAIAGIPVTAANYPKAVGILQKRFGQPKIVACAHFLALWKAPECREMTRQGIQTLVDEITKQLRCLAAMGKDPHAG